MEKLKQHSGIVKAILVSLFAGYLVTVIGVVILALLLLQFQLSEQAVEIGIIITYIISAFFAGFFAGKQLKNRKFVWGMITGLSYYLILLLVSVIARRQLGTDGRDIMTTFFICVGSGMLGGMIS